MSENATRQGNWSAGLATGCERLVNPQVTGEERGRQRRLLGVLLAGPFLVAIAVAQAFAPVQGIAGVLAALCAVFGASWLAALYLATSARRRETEFLALGGATVLVGALVALSGGIGTPIAALAVALPVEGFFVSRSRKAAAVGGVAAIVALLAAWLAGDAAPVVGNEWLWLSPVLYGGSLALRIFGDEAGSAQTATDTNLLPDDCFEAAIMRLNKAGEVESVSGSGAAMFGVDPALLLGSGLFDRVHVADRVAFLCAAAQTRSEAKPSNCAVRIRMPASSGGIYKPFEVEFVRPGPGETIVLLIRDGSELATLRDDLAQALEQASATDLAKSRFLAAVSHELRTPLNAIIGFSDMLLHREISGDMAPKQVEHVSLIREAGNHLLSVVNAILDVSKIEAGSYHIAVEPFDLKPAAELCCAMLAPQAATKGVSLTAKVPLGIGDILGDQRAVQQILINLLSNAIKFTPEGGTVSVSAARADDMMRIFVNDTGIGITADDLARLGQPFTQVQNDYTRQFQGTGLGLSLVKGLVKLHGGAMSMESAPGLGTTVTISLPVANGDSSNQNGETGEEHGIALRKTA